jgi:nitrogen-specific signal transduction histidine kinase
VGYVAIQRDITEEVELQKQLAQAQKMEAIGTLAGGIAHDFNNILQVVLGYTELVITGGEVTSRVREDLTRVYEAAKGGAELVQRLLTFSRKTEFSPRPMSLNRQVQQLQKMLSRTIPKMIEIKLALAEDLAAVNADPTQIDQVLMNLAVNARDAMPDGGALTIETQNVELDEDYSQTHLEVKPGPFVMLAVSDTGHGMDSDTIQHIFEPFFTTKGPREGTGLGLAMVYGVIKQHGGHAICYSEPLRGTTFKLYFPALISEQELQDPALRPLPRGGTETILVVDDEEFIRDLGSRMLTRAGYKVITATEGSEALAIYAKYRDEISLVILDLMMPHMGGKECLQQLRQLDPSVKVIIASGYAADAVMREASAAGARGAINKPYEIRQVLEVVRTVLDAE